MTDKEKYKMLKGNEEQNTSTELNSEQIRTSLERAIAMQVVIARQEKEAVISRPKKEGNIYTPETIERFTDEAIKFTSGTSKQDAEYMKHIYMYVLNTIPSWQQDLVMEGRRPIVLGSEESINKLKGREATYTTFGSFSPHENKIYASVDPKTLSHEKGHQFDYGGEKQGYFSDSSTAWKNALEREQAKGWKREKAIWETLEYVYPGDYSIKNHLSQGYKPEQLAREAMAEMTAIYNMVYREYSSGIVNGVDITGVDHSKERLEKTNALMEKAYPELFPVYRDEFIPHAVKKVPNVSKAADIADIKQAAKSLSAILPTNFDNLAIAGIAANAVAVWSMMKGESVSQAAKAASETGLEVSGLAAAGRALNAGQEGNSKEAAIQAVDALGIPVVAAREGMAGMKETIGKQVEFGKSLKPSLPKTVADAKLLERIVKDPKVKEIVKAYSNVLSLKEQSEMDSINPDIHLRLNAAENKFSKTFAAALEDPALGKQMLSELEKGGRIINALKQANKTPHEPSRFTPYGKATQRQAGITPRQ